MIWFVNTNRHYTPVTCSTHLRPFQEPIIHPWLGPTFRPPISPHVSGPFRFRETLTRSHQPNTEDPWGRGPEFSKNHVHHPLEEVIIGWKKISVLGATTPAGLLRFWGALITSVFFLPFGHYFSDDFWADGRWVGWPILRIQTHHTTHQQSS